MGADKGAVTIDGRSLLDRAIARISPIASTVILASGRNPVERRGAITVLDAGDGRGPLAGIVASLRAAPDELCAAVGVDMPEIDADLLLALARRCAGHDAAVPVGDRGVEPLHAVYSRSALNRLQTAVDSPDLSIHGALRRLRVRYMNAASLGASPGFARNLNTPDDVMAWLTDRAGARPPH